MRNKTRVVHIGNKLMGGDNPILIQTMANVKTSRVDDILKMDKHLRELGNDLLRLSVLDKEDALAFKELSSRTDTPLIADIHFNYEYAIMAMENGAKKIRINPGNIGGFDNLRKIIDVAKFYKVPIRIGVNSGSLGQSFDHRHDSLESYLKPLDDSIKVFEAEGFHDLVLSLKSSDPNMCYAAYKEADRRYIYPLHLGVTETGGGYVGALRTAVALVPLLKEGIGNTIRISLTEDPSHEVIACKQLLKAMGLRKNVPVLISCPTCGRTQVNLIEVYNKVAKHLENIDKDIKVAVMGCPVNGPGEAKDADIGLAGAKDAFMIFKKGKPVKVMPEEEAIKYLFDAIDKF
ncbi:MAG: flavodoxin-dependent (E)-4-hydroxy-3-methylbut-2-enyl-diphosphate synthase [Bacilli bacterium]|nr:flavodoxin-dependent (E)-4-hydroxy-3-methylbut-2-enyl-diphosphate synthase [Bacilli bacterium]